MNEAVGRRQLKRVDICSSLSAVASAARNVGAPQGPRHIMDVFVACKQHLCVERINAVFMHGALSRSVRVHGQCRHCMLY